MDNKGSDIIADIVNQGAAPALKSAGFKKSGLKFYRRRNEVMQVVGFQLSQGNHRDEGRFYINVAIGFDKLWQLQSKSIPERPKEHECHFYKRLEEILPHTRVNWDVSSSTDVEAMAKELRERMIELVSQFDGLTFTGAMLKHNLLEVGADLILKAQLHYVAGEFQNAVAEVKAAAKFFSGRKGTSALEIIVQNHMPELAQLL